MDADEDEHVAAKSAVDAAGVVADRAYDLATFDVDDIATMHALCGRYSDQAIGVTDASVAVLADRYATDAVLTLDERHFRVLRRSDGTPFRLLPRDG